MTRPSLRRRLILIVDDNEANLYLLRTLLQGHGCEVATATNGAEALEAARQRPPDLIVSDILMPVMDGFALCREWKKDERLRTVPFMFYTATYTDERDEQFALSLGAERFVVKPEEPDVLVAIMEETIEQVGDPTAGRVRPASEGQAELPIAAPEDDETRYLTLYNRALVRKLEAKMAQLEQANLELRESHQYLEEAQRIAHVGSWTLDLTTGATTWSAEMYHILEFDPAGPAVGFADMSMRLSPDGVSRITTAIERAIQTDEPWREDVEISRPQAGRGWIAVNGIVELGDTGAAVRVRGTVQDVTERRELNAQLRQSQRLEAVGLLAGGVAHDFNNLLTAIRGYAELACQNLGPSEEAREDLDQVLLAADRAAELTRQLLAFSRRQVLQPRVLDPAAIVEGLIPLLRRLLGEHIKLATHTGFDLGHVKVDPSQFEQVIVNLAVNARDAMPEGGTLTIETANVELGPGDPAVDAGATPGSYVALIVSDTGQGMDQATRVRIFEPFFTTKKPSQGTGMGLATVYGIVRQSGGSISIDSEPGHGSTFKVYLPRVEEESALETPTAPPVAASTGSEAILLVEDQEAVRRFAARILAAQGYTILQASGGAEALELAAAHDGAIDLLITDMIMPGLQGPQLARQLSAIRPSLRVLYVSGFSASAVGAPEVPDRGMAFLPKPFSGEALGRAVREALDRRP